MSGCLPSVYTVCVSVNVFERLHFQPLTAIQVKYVSIKEPQMGF